MVAFNTAARVREITRIELGVEAERVTRDARLQEDLGAESLDVFEILMELEEEFGIDIPDEDVAEIETVGQLEDYVAARTREAA